VNRNDTMKITPRLQAFKDALSTTLHSDAQPLKALFREIGVADSYGYALADRTNVETLPSVQRLMQILSLCTDPTCLDYLASLQGRLSIPSPTAMGPADLDRLAELVDAFGTLLRFHAKAIVDGTFGEDDARLYESHASRLVRGVLAQTAFVHAQAVPRPRKAVSA
jgi:hypothetical protein